MLENLSQETKILIGISLGTIVILVAAVFFLSKTNAVPATPTSSADPNLVINSQTHYQGNAGAKVTVVEFGDYECPACEAAYPITKQIISHYNGQIKFAFRNFPLPQHQNAKIAAEAAEAAAAQGKFWQMHDMLYDKQNDWGESTNPEDYLLQYGQAIGLDMTKFKNDIDTQAYADVINKDQSDGNALVIDATPTFFVNNQEVQGVPTYDSLQSLIDKDMGSNN